MSKYSFYANLKVKRIRYEITEYGCKNINAKFTFTFFLLVTLLIVFINKQGKVLNFLQSRGLPVSLLLRQENTDTGWNPFKVTAKD